MKSIVGISRDHSGSMRGLTEAARKDYNSVVRDISQSSLENKIDTLLSVVRMGTSSSRSSACEIELDNKQIALVDPINTYNAPGCGTPLFKSLDMLIDLMEASPYAKDPEASFIAMVVTDGGENASPDVDSVVKRMKNLMMTDRWSFVFRVPVGAALNFSRRYGVPIGNTLEWEQTQRGIEKAAEVTRSAFTSYYSGVSRGVRSTSTFFKTNVDPQEAKRAIAAMDDISREVDILISTASTAELDLRDFVDKKTKHRYEVGKAFYQLTKYEKKIQPKKLVIVRDKSNGKVFAGDAARQLLGWTTGTNISASPGDHAGYEIFVQSTSYNRRIPAGAKLLYWDRAPL